MMRDVTFVILLAFVTQARAQNLVDSAVENQVGDAQNSADNLVDALLNRALEAVPLRHADLDSMVLGKSANHLSNHPVNFVPKIGATSLLELPTVRSKPHPTYAHPRPLPTHMNLRPLLPLRDNQHFNSMSTRPLVHRKVIPYAAMQEAFKKPSKLITEAPRLVAEMQKAMTATEYEGYSEDETVEVTFSGKLVPLSCDVTQVAIDLGPEALSQRVTKAMEDAYAHAVAKTEKVMKEIISDLGISDLYADSTPGKSPRAHPTPAHTNLKSLLPFSKAFKQPGKLLAEALRGAAETKREMDATEYEGHSKDGMVKVVFNGKLVPLRCDIARAAMDLEPEAVSQHVTEAMVDAHAQAVAGRKKEVQEILSSQSEGESDASWKPAVSVASWAAAAGMAPAMAEVAEEVKSKGIDPFFQFQPVCPASDGIFRTGQQAALFIAGSDNIEDYRPLINDVLIRVRTELCVLESFARETAYPFIQQKGVGWILPLHETSETYLAGVVFMVGTNFILLGSTKVVAILAIYHDIVIGLPARFLAKLLGLASGSGNRAEEKIEKLLEQQNTAISKLMMDKKVDAATRTERLSELSTEYTAKIEEVKNKSDADAKKREESTVGKAGNAAGVVAVPLRAYGFVSEKAKQVFEAIDTLCSRYLVAATVFYVILKTLHYVVFPDALDGLGRA